MGNKVVAQILGNPESYLNAGKKRYRIGGTTYETYLATVAFIRDVKDGQLLLFIPQSLVDEGGELFDLIKKVVSDYAHHVIPYYAHHVIPSIGSYRVGGEVRTYPYHFDDVALSIFVEFVERRPEELYLDVSTGQNIYVNALVEAARRYATYRALEAALEGGAFEIHILTYQPITREVEEVDVHLYTLRPTAHLQLPPVDLNSIFRNNSDKPKLKNYSQHRERLNVMYKEVKRAFNALTYGIPLAFYQILKFTAEEGELEKTAIELVKSLQRENTPLRLVETTNIFFAIALYKSFKKFKNTLTEPYIDEIRDRFSELYKRIKMPAYDIYIRRELDDIEVRLKDIPYCKREVNLTEIYHTGGSGDRRRNFFAHAGFIKDYTKATREDGRIKLMWLEERIGEITSWIDNP